MNFDSEQKQILRDALAEFIGARVGFQPLLFRERAAAYVRERYPKATDTWATRKIEDVLHRCARAHALSDEISRAA